MKRMCLSCADSNLISLNMSLNFRNSLTEFYSDSKNCVEENRICLTLVSIPKYYKIFDNIGTYIF